MSIWHTEIDLEKLKERNKNTIVEYLNIEYVEVGDDYLIARMPVNQTTKQPIGILHGGATCVLAESVASVAGNCAVDIKQYYCVGLEINVNHLRPVRDGYIYGKSKPFHLGRSTQVWSIEITNDQKQLTAVGRLTLAVINQTR